MYHLGIDIAKFKHDYCLVDGDGTIIIKPTSIANTREGFNELLAAIKPYASSELQIGFESTGHYAENLKVFLFENNYSFMILNPLLVSKRKSSITLRRTKTDKLDSYYIAMYIKETIYKPYSSLLYHTGELKRLTRLRHLLIKKRSRVLVDITNVLDVVFPEFKPFFNNRLGPTAMYVLETYKTPEKISKLTLKQIKEIEAIAKKILDSNHLTKLVTLAKNTVGSSNAVNNIELDICIQNHFLISKQIDMVESEIEYLMTKIPNNISSIPGVGKVATADIISEIGSFELFDSYEKILSFVGLEPSTKQSGTMDLNGRMVKRGSGYLRYYLMYSAQTVLMHIPEYYDYYQKKRSEGKAHWVSISHVAKKLLRMMYHLESKNIKFKHQS